MPNSFLPLPLIQAFGDDGVPLSGGLIYTYEPGTFVKVPTYQDPDGQVLNSNPIELDGAGRAGIYATGEVRMILNDVDGNLIYDRVGRVLQDAVYTTVNAGALIAERFYPGQVNAEVRVTHTFDSRTTRARLRLVGGGGGGGGCDPAAYTGGGGGAGGFIEMWRKNIAPNTGFFLDIVMEAGSLASGAGQTAQSGGRIYLQDPVISTTIAVANGGSGGGSHSPNSSGGSGATGSVLANHPDIDGWVFGGEWGEDGMNAIPTGTTPQWGGHGGNSFWGGAGRAGVGSTTTPGGISAFAYGSGGGGAYGGPSVGGNGSPPSIWIEEYSDETVNNPGSSGNVSSLAVTGQTTLHDLTVSGTTHATGPTTIDSLAAGALTVTGNLGVQQNTNMLGTLTVGTNLTAGNLTATNATVSNGTFATLTVTGALQVSGQAASLPLTGGTLTGPLTLASDPVGTLQAATKSYVDTRVTAITNSIPTNTLSTTGGTMTGQLQLAADPSTSLQAATKHYVDVTVANVSGGGSSVDLPLTGGTLTGPLVLAADPSSSLQAATKHYVDTSLAGINQGGTPSAALLTTGGTMTGALVLAGDPTAALQSATKQYVDNHALPITGGTLTGSLVLAGDPTASLQPATKHYVDVAIANVPTGGSGSSNDLPLTGGTLTGPLTLAADPASSLQAATKHYVDTALAGINQGGTPSAALLTTGGTMTGALVLAGDPTAALQPATKQYVDTKAVPVAGGTMTGALQLSADPSSSLQAATKHYVDTMLAGINQGGTPSSALLQTGGTMTGDLILNRDPSNTLGAATKHYVDNAIATIPTGTPSAALLTTGGTMTGSLVLATDPTSNLQAATKHYVDASIAAIPTGGGGTPSQALLQTGGTMTGPLILAADPTSDLAASTKHYVDATFANAATSSQLATVNTAATNALNVANTANTTATTANNTATTANNTATNAATTATNALNTANSLQSQVSTANNNATNALNTANTANGTANNAQTTANTAASQATSAGQAAQGAQTRADQAYDLASANSGNTFNGGTVANATTFSTTLTTNTVFNASGEFVGAFNGTQGQFRAIANNTSAMWRNDGANSYFLSNANSTNGSWDNNRPFAWNLNTGNVTIAGSGNDTTIGGRLYPNGGLNEHYITYQGGQTVNPIGNGIPTRTALDIRGVTNWDSGREWMLCVGLDSNTGRGVSGSDKVGIYSGIIADNNNSGDIWGINTVNIINGGANNVASQGCEFDVNNNSSDRAGASGGLISGCSVTGASTQRKTCGYFLGEVNPGKWWAGTWLTNNSVSSYGLLDDTQSTAVVYAAGSHANGLHTANAAMTGPSLYMAKGQQIAWEEVLLYADSNRNMTIGQGASGVFFGAGGSVPGAVAPGADNVCNLGFPSVRFAVVWAVNGTIQSSDITKKTNVEKLPPTLDLLMAIDPIKFNWRVGGQVAVTRKEKQVVQETKMTYRKHTIHDFVDGKAIEREVEEPLEENVYDEVPVLDKDGKPVMQRIKGVFDKPDTFQPKVTLQPRMVEKEVEVVDHEPTEGKRTHWGFSAQNVKQAFDKFDMGDFGGYVKAEDGSENLRPDQLIPVLWRAVQELTKEVRSLKAAKA